MNYSSPFLFVLFHCEMEQMEQVEHVDNELITTDKILSVVKQTLHDYCFIAS